MAKLTSKFNEVNNEILQGLTPAQVDIYNRAMQIGAGAGSPSDFFSLLRDFKNGVREDRASKRKLKCMKNDKN